MVNDIEEKLDYLIEEVYQIGRIVRRMERQTSRISRLETRLCTLGNMLGVDITDADKAWEARGIEFHKQRTRENREKYKEEHAND